MRSSGRAQVQLKVLDGITPPAGEPGGPGGPGPRGSAVALIALDPGEWALVLRENGAQLPAGHAIREMLRGLQALHPVPTGRLWTIARAQPAVLAVGVGPAVLRHSRTETVLYCSADQITTQAAQSLAALAARATELFGPAAPLFGCQVGFDRVRHRDLPVDLHPAVTTVRGSQVTAHVCSRLITYELAVAMGALCTAYAAHVAQRRTARRLRGALGISALATS